MYHLDKKEIRDITNYIFLENALAPADVIFIPGCARPEHTEEAARLYREGYATLLIPSGTDCSSCLIKSVVLCLYCLMLFASRCMMM